MVELGALTLVLVTFAAFGLSYIIGQSKITLGLREWMHGSGGLTVVLELMECPACLGFWIGLFGALLNEWSVAWSLVAGCYICATNLILWNVVYALVRSGYGARTINADPPRE